MSDAKEDGWNDYGPGVKVKRLGGDDGAGFYLMRLEPDAAIPSHSHPQRETIIVLEGVVAMSTWPVSDPYRRRHVDRFSPDMGQSYREFPPAELHEIVAHSTSGALLLSIARPDWPSEASSDHE